MRDVTIFVDESGNTDLDTEKAGASSLYIVTAVIVPTDKIDDFEHSHAGLFGNAEAKSSSLRTARRRAKRLDKLAKLDFSYTSMIVHKSRIKKDSGYQYKKSLIKDVHKRLFNHFCRLYGNMRVVADECGGHEFMAECLKYYAANVKYPMERMIALPGRQSFSVEYVNSRDSRGVQVADLIAGVQRRVNEGIDAPTSLDCLSGKAFCVTHWPPLWGDIKFDKPPDDIDELIREISLRSVLQYIDLHEDDDDEDTKIRIETLRYLLDIYMKNDRLFVYADKIKAYLEHDLGYFAIKEQKFKHIIAGLRSAKVAIASKSSGYKIPTCFADIEGFIRKVHNTVDPYLRRLGLLRDMLYEASLREYDILDNDELRPMQRYING